MGETNRGQDKVHENWHPKEPEPASGIGLMKDSGKELSGISLVEEASTQAPRLEVQPQKEGESATYNQALEIIDGMNKITEKYGQQSNTRTHAILHLRPYYSKLYNLYDSLSDGEMLSLVSKIKDKEAGYSIKVEVESREARRLKKKK